MSCNIHGCSPICDGTHVGADVEFSVWLRNYSAVLVLSKEKDATHLLMSHAHALMLREDQAVEVTVRENSMLEVTFIGRPTSPTYHVFFRGCASSWTQLAVGGMWIYPECLEDDYMREALKLLRLPCQRTIIGTHLLGKQTDWWL